MKTGKSKTTTKNDEWSRLSAEILAFRDARDWKQFHTPKNLAAGISIESAELLEHFLWCTDEEAKALVRDKAKCRAVSEELADVVNYALLLADCLEIDLPAAIRRKIRINARKYPVRKSKGRAAKYTEL